jgi:acylphosphatase
MKAIHGYVSGRVQGVTFRQACRQTARGLDLVGWVRNLPDGRVEVWAQGDPDACDKLADWLWAGPPAAVISGVEVDSVSPDRTLRDFFIHPDPR